MIDFLLHCQYEQKSDAEDICAAIVLFIGLIIGYLQYF